MWIDHWSKADQSFSWIVQSPRRAYYDVTLLVAAVGGSRVIVETRLGHVETIVPEGNDYWGANWQRVELPGPLLIEEGISQVRVRGIPIGGMPDQNYSDGAAFLGLELIRATEHEAHRIVVAKHRADATWLGDATYGLMVQWGEWSFPKQGPKAQWPAQIDAFDVERFAEMAARTGAGYVIWSATWRSYHFPAPIRSIDEVIAGRTCQRDLIMELARALRARGIRLILYYNGITDDAEWHRHVGYPKDDAVEGDRRPFDARWQKIVREVGIRYGDLLDGWMIDEGSYPRDFESMSAALKAGSERRIVTINSWIRCRLTDHQDFYMGEGVDLRQPERREAQYLSTIEPNTGRFVKGPQAGLHSHGCFLLDTQSTLTDWGIWQPNADITDPLISEEDIQRMAHLAVKHKHALSFNIMMYQDGSVSERSLERLELMKRCVVSEKQKQAG